MMSIWREVRKVLVRMYLILWKNLLFRKRHSVGTALEIVLPTILAMIIAFYRTQIPGKFISFRVDKPETRFPLVTEQMALSRAASFLVRPYSGDIIAFAPNNQHTFGIMEKVRELLQKSTGETQFELKGYSTEDEIEIHFAELALNNLGSGRWTGEQSTHIKVVVVFEGNMNNFPSGTKVGYKIRPVDITGLDTNSLFPSSQEAGPGYGGMYQDAGLTGLQIAIDKTLIRILTGVDSPQTMNTQIFPYPSYGDPNYGNKVYFAAIAMFIVLGFIFIVPTIIRNVVAEKETGIKELMKMMGLPNWMHWLGWMLNSMLVLTLSVTIIVVLFFIPFSPRAGAVLSYSDPTLWWVVLILYSMAAIAFCFLISTFFRRPMLAILFGILLWLVTYFVPFSFMELSYESLTFTEKMSSALLPNMALHWAVRSMGLLEGKGVGARWSNIAEAVGSTDDMSVGYFVLMLILDIIIYTTLAIYIDNVIPSEFGVRKPLYYPFLLSTWYTRNPKLRRVAPIQSPTAESGNGFEEEPAGLHAGVVIQNLKKRFGRNKMAVDMEGTLKMYDGQITALLGHNGAGKTTLFSMLTGMFGPSSGTATVNGFDITTDMDNVRNNLGLCPQHNMLFDELTVEQHLLFFGGLTGLSKSETRNEMNSLLIKLNLVEKLKTLAKDISGGQKRKLSLGVALIGGNKVVILDEPTSGMDPEARRGIWDLLLGMRGERTIILTTHFMEEADVLGDRIAIMADGKVKCCGSPMYLKKYYGAGYTLKMTLEKAGGSEDLLSIVQQHIPSAFIKTSRNPNSTEVDITIPNESNPNTEFPRLFTTLSDRKGELGILTVGLSSATMDDIFVKVGEENAPDGVRSFETEMTDGRSDVETKATNVLFKKQRMGGLKLICHQFIGILLKRMLYTFRKRNVLISQFLMPILLLILCILLSNNNIAPSTSTPPLKMDLSAYSYPVTLFRASNKALAAAYKKTVGSSAISTSRNLDEELMRIGGKNIPTYRRRYIVAGDLNATSVTAMFSSIPYHSSPLSVNLMTNAILGTIPGSNRRTIQVTIHPLNSQVTTLLDPLSPNLLTLLAISMLFGSLLPFGLALFAASCIVFPVEEKLCKAKQLQMMTGVSPILYWGSAFIWDFFLMFILVCLMVICFPIFQYFEVFTAYNAGGVFFLILMLFGFSAISFSYLCSTFVATVTGGFSFVTMLHIFTGLILSIIVYLCDRAGLAYEYSEVVFARIVGRLFPAFGASMSIMRFTSIAITNSRCNILSKAVKDFICNPNNNVRPEFRQCCPNCASFNSQNGPRIRCFEPQSYLTWEYDPIHKSREAIDAVAPGIGQELLYLFLIGLFYKLLLMVIEYGLVGMVLGLIFKSNPAIFQQRNPEDEDVLMENQRVATMVNTGKVNEDALVVENLCKSFGSFSAVSGLSFGVHYGECFGLLGVNGAGKTTAFRMLTGDEFRSHGNAFGHNCTLAANRTKFLSLIGYCPQFDGIVGVLTGREMLQLFCRLRGVSAVEADKWLQKLGLLESGNVQCQKYSGGMKRRLCAAIALVGDPPIILLDEPTSGVDPIARRQFWNVISSVRDAGQAVVLTSHSMEECESLCSRLGIMVNGQFQCFGGVQHLKNKFAQGFRLVIKLKMNSEDLPVQSALSSQIELKFNPCTLKDKHQNILEYQVADTGNSWGTIFSSMEELRTEFPEVIEDYSVSETTLEQVFLSFARGQYAERKVNVSCCKKLVTCQCCK